MRLFLQHISITEYLGLKLLNELHLPLLFVLIHLQLASVAATFFIQATSELRVLLYHAALDICIVF